MVCFRDGEGFVSAGLWSSRREADLSTEQARSQAPPRVSRANGDRRRTQGAERAPRARPQAPFGLTAIRAGSARPPGRSGESDASAGSAAAGDSEWGRLTRRPEFQRAAKGRRAQLGALTLQGNRRPDPASEGPRVGLTVTKKVGNAVVRNRIRRRLREALRRVSRLEASPDHDYVLLARGAALTIDFKALVGEIERGFRQLRRAGPRPVGEARDRDGRS